MTIVLGLLWKIPVVIIFVAINEWWVHRYLMHRKVRGLEWIYNQHHMGHHVQGHNELRPYIDLHWSDYWAAIILSIIPVVRICLGDMEGVSGLIAIGGVCFCHWYLWNHFHRNIHELEGKENWTRHLPGYKWIRQHHIDHHNHTNRNFGVVFPWIDIVMRTRYIEKAKNHTS